MDLKKKILKKIKNNSGETITEVLVALLISVLSLTLLAGMIAASVSMTDKSRKNITEYYSAENALEQKLGGQSQNTETVSFKDGNNDVKLSKSSITVYVYSNGDTKNEVLSYSVS